MLHICNTFADNLVWKWKHENANNATRVENVSIIASIKIMGKGVWLGWWNLLEWTKRHGQKRGCGKCRSGHNGTMWQGWTLQEWSEVNKAVYKITRLAETLMSAGGQSSTRIFTVDYWLDTLCMQSSDVLVADSDITGGAHRPLSLKVWNRLLWVDVIIYSELISRTVGDFQLVLSTFFTGIGPLLHCPLPHCPPLPHGAALSTPVMSTLATLCWFVHSYKFHPCNMVPICQLLHYPLPQIQCSTVIEISQCLNSCLFSYWLAVFCLLYANCYFSVYFLWSSKIY